MLDKLVKTYSKLHVTAVVRSVEDLAILDKQSQRVNVVFVVCSLENTTLLESMAGNASILISS